MLVTSVIPVLDWKVLYKKLLATHMQNILVKSHLYEGHLSVNFTHMRMAKSL